MVYSYDELLKQKQDGVILVWDKITKDQLEQLFIIDNISDNMIANLYNINKEKVQYKRHKWDLKLNSAKCLYKSFANKNKSLFDKLNNDSKVKILNEENIDNIAIALTHYFFRNGPIEDMHANNQLSQSDMKILNKYMVNKIATLIKLIIDEEWLKISMLLDFFSRYGYDWDKAEIDMEEVNMIFYNALSRNEKIVS